MAVSNTALNVLRNLIISLRQVLIFHPHAQEHTYTHITLITSL